MREGVNGSTKNSSEGGRMGQDSLKPAFALKHPQQGNAEVSQCLIGEALRVVQCTFSCSIFLQFFFFFNNTKLELHSGILDCGNLSLQPDLQSAEVVQKLLLAYFIASEGLRSLLMWNEELIQENKQMKNPKAVIMPHNSNQSKRVL